MTLKHLHSTIFMCLECFSWGVYRFLILFFPTCDIYIIYILTTYNHVFSSMLFFFVIFLIELNILFKINKGCWVYVLVPFFLLLLSQTSLYIVSKEWSILAILVFPIYYMVKSTKDLYKMKEIWYYIYYLYVLQIVI